MKSGLTRPAIRDLTEIGRNTRETRGEEQARRYRTAITARLTWLCHNKSLWSERPELTEGVYTCHEQRHAIVFREYEDGIEILRVLHERMVLVRHVEDDEHK
jgi:toxin ParE1/3/4